jgi:membrane protein implicated in regulation of membrane protease activity
MENIFLACFAFGALFTLASLALGFAGHGAAHLGHGAAHIGHGAAHIGHGAAHIGHGGHGVAHGQHLDPHVPHAHANADAGRFDSLPLLNASSVVGALTWFGAEGYLLVRLVDWALPAVVLGALLAGGVGWYLVARFLGLVLSGEREMDPDDYRLEGTVSQVTVSIPAGGTGEVVFSKAGARRSEAARAMGGTPIPRGTEVVITSYTDGFATVQPWGEFLAARDTLQHVATEKKEA